VDPPLDLEILGDLPRLAQVLERQAPGLPTGTQGYGATAWGKYAGVLFWKITGETVGTWLARELCGPLGADVYLGLPPALDARLARLIVPGPRSLFDIVPHLVASRGHDGRIYRSAIQRSSPTARALANPRETGRGQLHNLSDPRVLRTELPWVGAAASARGLARLYGALAQGGELDGTRILSPEAAALPAEPVPLIMDRVLHKPLAWRLGMMKERAGEFLPGTEGFGHPGAGGSVGWCDPPRGAAIGYVMNRMDHRLRSPRAARLCRAFSRCLDGPT